MARMATIKKTLQEAGIYTPKLDPQIALAESLRKFLRRDDLEPRDFLKASSQLQSAYTALGLTYASNPDHLPTSDNDVEPLPEM